MGKRARALPKVEQCGEQLCVGDSGNTSFYVTCVEPAGHTEPDETRDPTPHWGTVVWGGSGDVLNPREPFPYGG